MVTTVLEALERDLAALPEVLASGSLAASLRVLAVELDAPNTATARALCAKGLRDGLDRLRELAPPVEEGDQLDDLAARRGARRATA